MKKITILFLSFIAATLSYGQCTTFSGGNWPSGMITIQNDGTEETIAPDNWPNAEFSAIAGLIIGNDYTVIGTNTSSIYITVTETNSDFSSIGTVITYGASSVSFTATTSEILIFWHLNSACATQASDNTSTTIECTSPSCTCTASAAPDTVTSTVTPSNGATDVPITYGSVNSVGPFEWTVPATGDSANSFNFSLGTDPAGTNIGTINNLPNGSSINYNWQPSTTYYWYVVGINCAGSTQSTVFSFTTASCSETSAPDLATGPSPADGAVDVPLSSPDNGVTFTWTSGSASESFTLNIGTTAFANDVSFDGFLSGEELVGFSGNTTYYWSLDASNCFGTTNGTIWSFTIGAALSVKEKELEIFNIYPNPTNDVLYIKSNLKIEQIQILNLLGQNVLTLGEDNLKSNTIDVSEFKSGIYIMKVKSDLKEQSVRFIKE